MTAIIQLMSSATALQLTLAAYMIDLALIKLASSSVPAI